MFLWTFGRKVLQGAVLIVGFSGIQAAMADSIHDWEDSAVFDDDSAEAQGLSPDNMHEAPEHEVLEEVKFTPKRQNHRGRPKNKAMAKTQRSYPLAREIKDETATTGENAKKHLPNSVKQQKLRQDSSPYDPVYHMTQVLPQLITINAQ